MKRKFLSFIISFVVCISSISTPVLAEVSGENTTNDEFSDETYDDETYEEDADLSDTLDSDSAEKTEDDEELEDKDTEDSLDIVSDNEMSEVDVSADDDDETASENKVTIVSENELAIDNQGAVVESGQCGATAYYELTTNQSGLYTLSITGSGDMSDYVDGNYIGIPWYSYRSTISEVTIANGITYIEGDAFKNLTSLNSITIPSSVADIGNEAFKNCSSLQSVKCANGLERLGDRAFQDCTALKRIVLPDSVTSIGTQMFSGCTCLENATLPRGLTVIPEYIFYGCSSLDEFVINNGVTAIKDSAFEGCTSLSQITIPNTVTELGIQTFNNCDSLSRISVPNSVVTIGTHCFSESDNLESVVLPEGISNIPIGLFYKCISLESVNIPNRVTSIGNFAFEGCRKLKSVELPDGLLSIGEQAFKSCERLTELVIPNGVTSIKNGTFWWCVGLKKITLPNGITSIGNSAFYFCNELEEITMPNSLITIGESAFESCYSLQSLSLKGDVTTIETKAFSNCTNLGRVTILDSVTSIASDAFSNSQLVLILCNAGSYAETFADNHGITKMILGSEQQYSGSCGDNATWNLDCKSGLLEIDGTGEMIDYVDTSSVPWLGYRSYITSVEIKDGITKIGSNSFMGCSSLTKVKIPESVTDFGDDCFRNCSSLVDVYIPSGEIVLRAWAFAGCTKLKKVIFSSSEAIDSQSMLIIDSCVFKNCSALEEVWIYQDTISMNNSTFSDCLGLTIYGHYYGTSGGFIKLKSEANTFAINNGISFVSIDKYSIVFNGNGATRGRVSSIVDCEMGTEYTLPANTFIKKGHQFNNWNGYANGIGRKYYPGDNVKDLLEEGSYTFYAIWTPNTYTVNYDANGGSGLSSSSQEHTYGVEAALLGAPSKAGYSFIGWNTSPDGSGTMYGAGSRVKNLTDEDRGTVTLYAQWGDVRYSIIYNLNGGINNSNNPTSYPANSGAIILKNPVRTGYTFGGWYLDSGFRSRVTQINAGSSGNKTLYAKWSENSYKIAFNRNGGKGKMKAIKTLYSKSVKLPKCSFTRTVTVKVKKGNKIIKKKKTAKFRGWSLTPGGPILYKNGAKVKNLSGNNGATVTLYAVWNK